MNVQRYLLSHCTRGHRTHAQPQPPKKDIFFFRGGILLVKMAETSKVFFFGRGGTFSVSWKKKELLLEEIRLTS